MLDITETLNPLLNVCTRQVEQDELDPDEDEDTAKMTLQLIFFDGEEAFMYWLDMDPIYGARSVFLSSLIPTICSYICSSHSHLTKNWAMTYLAASQAPSNVSLNTTTPLSSHDSSLYDQALGPA
jgi:hypothetical protein